ncbi:helix-turn-helix domain-containing protein [Tsukamurella ocularis]|uniref:helix-turn-helix domain-containing protein n=1 Tax=Tsukamurella ocularis TaxID=1970234 RepID=UPI002168567F|nr:helix-turn-helix transcriptional regulator [Tsukamurella ocularis]MCS3780387.1 transcriptional regulator with XRE-family HTH domain [Tsukamurella ocularis]MCS3786058.1 transcriptional regulator with XRE-family HTH domain [Tsukamurella ocularis]MCS3849422.1 transcriptional regulator with XRE-family HTH domain [Tsukamurella ocularis]
MTIGGEALFRHELGGVLRRRRQERGERLADTAARAGISPQYLSEIERGLKDPSSEMLAAIAGALGTGVGAVAVEVGRRLGAARPVLRLDRTARPAAGPVSPEPAAPAPRLLTLAA